jgi:DNA-directed RNA polymerase, mitochondrial
VWLPQPEAPRPWTGWNKGGTWDERLARTLSIIRERQNSTREVVEHAIRNGTMKPTLDALNALQAVAWTINTRVLDVMRECVTQGISVSGLPAPASVPQPEDHLPHDNMTDRERTAWKIRQSELRKAKRRLVSDRAQLAEDMKTAEMLAERECFWTAMNMDWRGRVYGLPNFNLQREERVRALFLFADGEPIGEEGLYWLKVHLANCGDDRKISKQPFKERVAWVDRNMSPIIASVSDPLSELWWTKADKPFMFLAACFELVAAVDQGPTYVSRFPIFFDGSCNGLQHLCAMMRSEEGKLVNLAPQERPKDIYQTVADSVKRQVTQGLHDEDKHQLAQMCLDWIWYASAPARPRKTFKRNIMTYAYSSKAYGMCKQLREDTMDPLKLDVLKGKLKEHPFGPDNGYAASQYLAEHVYNAIEQVVEGPAKSNGISSDTRESLGT